MYEEGSQLRNLLSQVWRQTPEVTAAWETEAGSVWIWDQLGYTIRPRIDNLGASIKNLHFFLNQQCTYDTVCQTNDLAWGLALSPRTQSVSVEIMKHGYRLLCAHHSGEGGEWKPLVRGWQPCFFKAAFGVILISWALQAVHLWAIVPQRGLLWGMTAASCSSWSFDSGCLVEKESQDILTLRAEICEHPFLVLPLGSKWVLPLGWKPVAIYCLLCFGNPINYRPGKGI